MWDDLDIQQKSELMRLFIKNNIYSLDKMKEIYNDTTERQYSSGGQIHIAPSKRGTFKAQASRMGMTVQEAASHILANKGNYSPAMVKKANFARNFAHADGGNLFQKGGMTRKGNSYDVQWDETGTYQRDKNGNWTTAVQRDDVGWYTERRGGGKRYTYKFQQQPQLASPLNTDQPTYNLGLPLATGTAGAWGGVKQTEADKQFEKEFKEAQEKYQKQQAQKLIQAVDDLKTTKGRVKNFTVTKDAKYRPINMMDGINHGITRTISAWGNDDPQLFTRAFLTTPAAFFGIQLGKYNGTDHMYKRTPSTGYGPIDLYTQDGVPTYMQKVSDNNVFPQYDNYLKTHYPNRHIPTYLVKTTADTKNSIPFEMFEPDTTISSEYSFPYVTKGEIAGIPNYYVLLSGGDYIDFYTDKVTGKKYWRVRDIYKFHPKDFEKKWMKNDSKLVRMLKKSLLSFKEFYGRPYIYTTNWLLVDDPAWDKNYKQFYLTKRMSDSYRNSVHHGNVTPGKKEYLQNYFNIKF